MVIKPKIRISVYSSKKFSFCLVSLFGQMSVKPFYLFTWKLFHGCQNLDRGKIGCFKKFGQPQLIHNSTKWVITCQEVWIAFFLLCFSPPFFFFTLYDEIITPNCGFSFLGLSLTNINICSTV